MLSACPVSIVEYTLNDGSRLPGATSDQMELGMQPHPRGSSLPLHHRQGGRIPPASVMIAQSLFFFFFSHFGAAQTSYH